MQLRIKGAAVCLFFMITCSVVALPLNKNDFNFTTIEVEKLSRFLEERIVFQHIQDEFSPVFDNAVANLLIIKDEKAYLLKDGYDDPHVVLTQRKMLQIENRLVGDLWTNKINNKADYVKVTEKQVLKVKNFNEEFVSGKFNNLFMAVRNAFIGKHVETFRDLMENRDEAGLIVEREPLPKPIYLGAPETETKYSTTVIGKTRDEKVYYAEDADGDGVTETFYVNLNDGFNWGYKSGPNILLIYKNKDEGIKKLIGTLAHEAYFGTTREEKNLEKNFPDVSYILKSFDLEKITIEDTSTATK